MRPENSGPQVPFDPRDPVERATRALRDAPIHRGPSPELISITQAALRRAQSTFNIEKSFFLSPAVRRIAALIAIVCGGVLGHWVFRHFAGVPDHQNIVKIDPVKPRPPGSPIDSRPQPRKNSPAPAPTPTWVKTPPQPAPIPAPSAPILADGILAGRIIFDGVAPPPRPLMGFNMTTECIKLHGGVIYDESLVVDANGSLANVVVSVSDGLSGWLREEYPPPPAAVLDQKGCVFVPHVVPVMVGQQLSLRNSDPFLHNVHVMAVNNPPANVGQPSTSESQTLPFEAPEVFRVKCDVHPWMQAWVRVVDNPFFAVTGRDGRFTIRGLPPGTYTLKAWHEQLGVREQQIVIVPGEGTAVDFTFHAGPGGG